MACSGSVRPMLSHGLAFEFAFEMVPVPNGTRGQRWLLAVGVLQGAVLFCVLGICRKARGENGVDVTR